MFSNIAEKGHVFVPNAKTQSLIDAYDPNMTSSYLKLRYLGVMDMTAEEKVQGDLEFINFPLHMHSSYGESWMNPDELSPVLARIVERNVCPLHRVNVFKHVALFNNGIVPGHGDGISNAPWEKMAVITRIRGGEGY